MELNQLKLQFNNDIIKLKKCFMQARLQTINKLSKKNKFIKSKEYPDDIKEKFNKKAEAIVTEIGFLKKLDLQETVRFGYGHFDSLNKFIDTPNVDKKKAFSRVCTHKSLKPKLQMLLKKFSMVPAEKLLEVNPVKLNKKKKKERIKQKTEKKAMKVKTTDEEIKNEASESEDEPEINNEIESESDQDQNVESEDESVDFEVPKLPKKSIQKEIKQKKEPNIIKGLPKSESKDLKISSEIIKDHQPSKKRKEPKMFCDATTLDDTEIEKNVDPFFVTDSGEKYLTVAVQRPPDKLVNEHSNNRKVRRARMFGYEPSEKPRKNNKREWNKKDSDFPEDRRFKKSTFDKVEPKSVEAVTEKLHPSWEAKKQKQSLVAFQGQKIVFD